MKWAIFENLWKRTLDLHSNNDASTWNEEIEVLYRLGISMEDTLQYLYFNKSDFESFKSWVLQNKNEIKYINQIDSEDVSVKRRP
jgi:hypothetical protein